MVATSYEQFYGFCGSGFQSAFHRGNGCYRGGVKCQSRQPRAFSPLFIAAMVATRLFGRTPSVTNTFSPLFIAAMVATVVALNVSPGNRALTVRFSSRQWLLPGQRDAPHFHVQPFSPLFIAAMVATGKPTGAWQAYWGTFSPLFIAAMVATNHTIAITVN